MNEVDEFRVQAYENVKLYKEKMKRWHDKRIVKRSFKPGQSVLLFNLRLKLFPGKLKSRWFGPFLITKVFSYGAIEVKDSNTQQMFKINGQRLKHYWGGDMDCQKTSITLEDLA